MNRKDISIYYRSNKPKTKFKDSIKSATNFLQKENLNYPNRLTKNKFKNRKTINT